MLRRSDNSLGCVRRGCSDDPTILTSAVNHLILEKRRLESEERMVEGKLLELQQEMSELVTRATRLRYQKELLCLEGAEMVRRRSRLLDDLQAEERGNSEACEVTEQNATKPA